MKLLSLTLAGGNREDKIGGALLSVEPFVDAMLLVDTGESAQKAIEVARGIANPSRLHVVKWPHREFNCTQARNFALDEAYRLGFDWAVWCDTDERIHTHGFDIRQYLESTEASAIQVKSSGDIKYTKERFIRLPAVGRYVNGESNQELAEDVHEQYLGDAVVRSFMPDVRFEEIPKSKEEEDLYRAEIERKCRLWLSRDPNAWRPRLFLANSLEYFGNYHEAIEHYRIFAEGNPSDEQHGWAMFCVAVCLDRLKRHRESIDCAIAALRRCPWMVELHWILACEEFQLGLADANSRGFAVAEDFLKALAWADSGIALGRTIQLPRLRVQRFGFSFEQSEYEGCWEVRKNCLGMIGMKELADSAERMMVRAAKVRTGTLEECVETVC